MLVSSTRILSNGFLAHTPINCHLESVMFAVSALGLDPKSLYNVSHLFLVW